MDVSNKKTVLDDNADIYRRRTPKTERQTWKELHGFQEKFAYFRMYILSKVLIAVGILAAVIYTVYLIVRPKTENYLFVAILDGAVEQGISDDWRLAYEEAIGLDTKKYETRFDATLYISSASDMDSGQRLSAYVFAREVDVMIIPEPTFQKMATGYSKTLEEQLPEDLLAQVRDRICYVAVEDKDSENGEPKVCAYGIDVTDLIPANPLEVEAGIRMIACICGNTRHEENAVEFIRYLLNQEGAGKIPDNLNVNP